MVNIYHHGYGYGWIDINQALPSSSSIVQVLLEIKGDYFVTIAMFRGTDFLWDFVDYNSSEGFSSFEDYALEQEGCLKAWQPLSGADVSEERNENTLSSANMLLEGTL